MANKKYQLVGRDEGATDLSRSRLCLIHRGQNRQASNAEAGDPPTDSDLVPFVLGGDLHDNADAKDHITDDDTGAATELVCDRGGNQGTYESADAEERDYSA